MNLMRQFLAIVFLGAVSAFSLSGYDCESIRKKAVLNTIDFQRYLGHWYELYHSTDFYFDRGCSCTTADYSLGSDGSIKVDNKCQRSNRTVEKIGRAKIVGNASLEVSFGLPFKAPYDIFYIADDYSLAGVISCTNVPLFGGLELWILGRNPAQGLNVESIDDVIRRLHQVGLGDHVNDLVQTNQTHCDYDAEFESHLFEDDPHFYRTNLTGFDINKYFGQYNIIAEIPDTIEHIITRNCDCMRTAVYKNLTTEQQCLKHNNRTERLVGNLLPISADFSQNGRFIQKEGFITEHYQILDITDDYRHALVVNSLTFTPEFDISDCVYFLSRDPWMPNHIFYRFIDVAKELDIYNIEHLRFLHTHC